MWIGEKKPLTSSIPATQLSAIHPKGPPMLASPATGAKKLANLILDKINFLMFHYSYSKLTFQQPLDDTYALP